MSLSTAGILPGEIDLLETGWTLTKIGVYYNDQTRMQE